MMGARPPRQAVASLSVSLAPVPPRQPPSPRRAYTEATEAHEWRVPARAASVPGAHSVGESVVRAEAAPRTRGLRRQQGGALGGLRIECANITKRGPKAKAHLWSRSEPWSPECSPHVVIFVEMHIAPGDGAQLHAWLALRGWCAAVGFGKPSARAQHLRTGGVMIAWRSHLQVHAVSDQAA